MKYDNESLKLIYNFVKEGMIIWLNYKLICIVNKLYVMCLIFVYNGEVMLLI